MKCKKCVLNMLLKWTYLNNVLKYHLICVGKHYAKRDMHLLILWDELFSRVKEFKYLGCTIRAEIKLKVAIDVNF